MAKVKPEQIRTVGDLRAVIQELTDDCPVKVHVGTDVDITEWEVSYLHDGGWSDGLVLYPDDMAGTSWVSTSWLYKEHPELKAGQ